MKKTDLLIGAAIAFAAAAFGAFLFVALFTSYDFIEGLHVIKSQGNLGKVITLGAVLNIAIFFFLLKKNKELMARGVVLGTILLTIVTLFV